MRTCIFAGIAIITALSPASYAPAAYAQVTRNGNEYDFRDHQPTAAVQSQEQNAGVGLDAVKRQNESQQLRQLDNKLQRRAKHDARAVPQAARNVYGVQPGGVLHISPNAAGGGGGGAAQP